MGRIDHRICPAGGIRKGLLGCPIGGEEAETRPRSREGLFSKGRGREERDGVVCASEACEGRGTANEIRDGRFERVWSRVNRTERDD